MLYLRVRQENAAELRLLAGMVIGSLTGALTAWFCLSSNLTVSYTDLYLALRLTPFPRSLFFSLLLPIIFFYAGSFLSWNAFFWILLVKCFGLSCFLTFCAESGGITGLRLFSVPIILRCILPIPFFFYSAARIWNCENRERTKLCLHLSLMQAAAALLLLFVDMALGNSI